MRARHTSPDSPTGSMSVHTPTTCRRLTLAPSGVTRKDGSFSPWPLISWRAALNSWAKARWAVSRWKAMLRDLQGRQAVEEHLGGLFPGLVERLQRARDEHGSVLVAHGVAAHGEDAARDLLLELVLDDLGPEGRLGLLDALRQRLAEDGLGELAAGDHADGAGAVVQDALDAQVGDALDPVVDAALAGGQHARAAGRRAAQHQAGARPHLEQGGHDVEVAAAAALDDLEIGRASCRER